MKKLIFLTLFGLFSASNGHAQNIKSVLLRTNQPNSFTSIVPLGTPLTLSFDDLEADGKDYYYKIEHMTPDWETSRLLSSQYLSLIHI